MSKQEAEYECQFWRFRADEIATGLKKAIFDAFETCVTKLFDAVRQRSPQNLPVLAKNCRILLNELDSNSRERIVCLQKFVLETFSIPKHILLKEDSLQRQQYTEEDTKNIEKEIQQIWNEINRVHFLEACLSKELEKHKQIEAISERLKTIDIPAIDSLPNPKSIHHHILDTLGLEVEEANCHLKEVEETDHIDHLDERDNVLNLFRK